MRGKCRQKTIVSRNKSTFVGYFIFFIELCRVIQTYRIIMNKITVFFIIGLFSVSMHGRAVPDYPSKWKNEIQYIYDSIFPSIPSNELPPCEFKRRQWIPLQTRASIDVYNEEDLARAIANNQSITINLKSDIFLSGNSTSSRNNTGGIQAQHR